VDARSSLNSLRNAPNTLAFRVCLPVLVLIVYSYPTLRNLPNGSNRLPPIYAPDTSLYLSMSRLNSSYPNSVRNPYYGVDVPVGGSGHLQFRLAFQIFGKMTSMLGGNLWLSMFVWNLLWLGLLCGVAIVVFERFLPDHSPEVISLGLTVLMFFNFGIVKSFFLSWLHPSWPAFEELVLPHMRPFFPQVGIPLLLAYFGFQIEWLRTRRSTGLAAMGILQLIALATFPYTTLVMACITATVVVGQVLSNPKLERIFPLALYGVLCGLADLPFFIFNRAHQAAPYVSARIDFAVLHHVIGGMWILIALLTLISAVSTLPPATKLPLVGLGLANLALLTGDLFFPESEVMVSHHGGYFVHTTVTVLLTFLIANIYYHVHKWRPWLKLLLWVIAVAVAINGMLVALGMYRGFAAENTSQTQLVKALHEVPVGPNDLLVVRAEEADDDCSWAPLVSSATVLYCRNASVLLTREQNQTMQRFRQALYLYLRGNREQDLDEIMQTPGVSDRQLRLAFFGAAPSNEREREMGLDAVRRELFPLLDEVERHAPEPTNFFRRFARVIVIDDKMRSLFDPQRISSYLTVQQQRISGERSILVCAAK